MTTRRWTTTWVALVAALILLRAPAVQARDDDGHHEGERARPARAADIDVFWDALAPYGEWMDDGTWGWVWIPTSVPAGWRPYTHGSWALTDWGWTWDSDWDWGWAPFHYGRWIDDDEYGWLWLPGVEWGPAWVLWNEGDDWIGWAPLPPQVGWDPDSGLRFGHLDRDRAVPPRDFVFVRREHFADHDLERDIAPRPHNVTIAPLTRDVTRYEPVNGEVVDRSIPLEPIEKAVGHPIRRMRVEEVDSVEHFHAARGTGEAALPMFRPRIERGRTVGPRAEEDMLRRSPPAAVLERQRQEERALQERHAEERRALERVHEGERSSAARREAAQAMQQRQEMERSEMRTLQQRDQEQMMRRHQWEQSRMPAAPRSAEPRRHR
jgi:hypothetical protein